jgi:MOSC domain-containing protein YiiM
MQCIIDHVFVGTLRPLPPEGQLTGMFKLPVDGPVAVTAEGLAGDRQADRRYHGGTEKALHHYPVEHYAPLAQRYPERAGMLQAGVLGENLSTRGWTEHNVCIGDVFRVGSALVQLSQPRQPCWKINYRLDTEGASLFVAQEGITGWYYRVLEKGIVAPGDTFALVERPNPALTVAACLAATHAHRPEPGVLRAIAGAIGLAPELVQRLAGRAAWLENNRQGG